MLFLNFNSALKFPLLVMLTQYEPSGVKIIVFRSMIPFIANRLQLSARIVTI